MGRVRIVDVSELEWMKPAAEIGDGEPDDVANLVPTADPAESAARIHHRGSEVSPQLFEIRQGAHDVVEPHAHRTDEIIYVLEGEMHLGSRVRTPGSSVLIPADTLYGFTAGPDGLRFLNFRATRDTSFVTRAELVASRRARRCD
jgi:quercetin dioxygenase-like cupin family protein